MKVVFGPVPSRRLGQSLGIDTIPLKTCNWNCVYCQLGRTKPLCNVRTEYYPVEEIMLQVESALASHAPSEIDWITIVGSGEPTLHAGIGQLIREVKAITDIPVAVITNGSLLFLPDVREALAGANAVLSSLDAGTPQLYKKINRPHPEISFEKYIQGLIDFRQQYKGLFWIEVMLVHGHNDTIEALDKIAQKLALIKPDKVHIGLPTRPPVEEWVHMPDDEGIMRAISILGKTAEVVHPQAGVFDIRGDQNYVESLIGIITRHPMSEEQLYQTLESLPEEEQEQTIKSLQNSGKIQIVERFGQRFWCAASSFFPNNA